METDTSATPTQLPLTPENPCRFNQVEGMIEVLSDDGVTVQAFTLGFLHNSWKHLRDLENRNAILESENSRLNPARGARELVDWLNGCARMFEKSGSPHETTQAVVFRAVASKAKELIAIPD